MIGIYQVVNKLNNKSYVGQSVNITKHLKGEQKSVKGKTLKLL